VEKEDIPQKNLFTFQKKTFMKTGQHKSKKSERLFRRLLYSVLILAKEAFISQLPTHT
jgi:hypothetical protein